VKRRKKKEKKIHNGTILEVLVYRNISNDDLLFLSQFAKEAISYFDLKGHVNLFIGSGVGEIDGYHRYVNGEHYIYYAKISHLPTLTHEFIHASQYEKGDLFKSREVIYWKGEENNNRYLDQPWEIEAFDSQDKLTNEILKVLYGQ
jgi:hypothetical protein